MIKIRYADLPEGLHARAETHGRHAIIYLRPGLTMAQRREGLRRARRSARMGYGPSLPAAGVQVAVARDRVRITLRNVAAAVCQHPASAAVCVGAIGAAVISYVMFVSVSITFIRPSLPQSQARWPGHAAIAPPAVVPGHPQGGRRGADAPGPGPARPGTGRRASSPSPSPGVPGHSPGPTGSATPGPVPSPGGICLSAGPIGVCVSL